MQALFRDRSGDEWCQGAPDDAGWSGHGNQHPEIPMRRSNQPGLSTSQACRSEYPLYLWEIALNEH